MTEQTAPAPQETPSGAPTPPPATPTESSSASSSRTTTNDLMTLLEEFNAATKQPETPKPAAQSSAAQNETPSTDFMAEVDKALGAVGMTSELRNHLQNYATTVHALHAQHVQQRDMADFEKIVAHFDREARERGYHLGEDYARRWVMAESMLNPQIEDVFNHRYDSAENASRADRLIKRVQDRFLAAAKREPDPEVTADRAAVSWAVRNATNVAPPEKPVRYGDLNDAEFAAEKKKYGL